MATRTITALFDSYEEAATAVSKLQAAGLSPSDISVVAGAGGPSGGEAGEQGGEAADGAGAGAAFGSVLGGGAGLLAGLGLLAIPGLGPIVGAGWLAATLAGAGVGAAAGGLVGSLAGAGVSERDAAAYAEGVRRGGTLITVRANEANAHRAMDILEQEGAVDLDEREQAWRSERGDEAGITSPAPATNEIGSTAIGAAASTATGLGTAGLPPAASSGENAADRTAAETRPRVRSYSGIDI